MIAFAAKPSCLAPPLAWKPPGNSSIRSWTGLRRTSPNFQITRREPGAPRKPINYWSAMADTGGSHNKLPREVLPGVHVYPNPAEVALGASRRFVDYAWQSIARHGQFFVALSGGHTPQQMFQLLASPEF